MKTKRKKRPTRSSRRRPRGKQVDSPPPNKTPALPVEPPGGAEDSIYAHAPYLKIYTSDGAPPDRIPPTPVELLAFAAAIHGSGPLPKNHTALKKLFYQAFVLWRKSQYQIKMYSQYFLPHQEKKGPVLTNHDLEPQSFESYNDFVRCVTGSKRNDDARRAFKKWLDSMKPGNPKKEIEYWMQKFVDGSSSLMFLEAVKLRFSSWYRSYLSTVNASNSARRF